jgi:hypothetical protein
VLRLLQVKLCQKYGQHIDAMVMLRLLFLYTYNIVS